MEVNRPNRQLSIAATASPTPSTPCAAAKCLRSRAKRRVCSAKSHRDWRVSSEAIRCPARGWHRRSAMPRPQHRHQSDARDCLSARSRRPT